MIVENFRFLFAFLERTAETEKEISKTIFLVIRSRKLNHFVCLKKEKEETLRIFLVFPLFERNGYGFALCLFYNRFFTNLAIRFIAS